MFFTCFPNLSTATLCLNLAAIWEHFGRLFLICLPSVEFFWIALPLEPKPIFSGFGACQITEIGWRSITKSLYTSKCTSQQKHRRQTPSWVKWQKSCRTSAPRVSSGTRGLSCHNDGSCRDSNMNTREHRWIFALGRVNGNEDVFCVLLRCSPFRRLQERYGNRSWDLSKSSDE